MSQGQLFALVLLGLLHGINPGMGWLFAVSIGLQERSRRALLLSLPAIAIGHEASIALLIAVLIATSSLVTAKAIVLVGGGVLLAFGLWQLWSKWHPRWVGMRLSRWELSGWSFVMSSAHGAGLMLLAIFAFGGEQASALDLHAGAQTVASTGGLALLVHGAAMILACGVIALLVHGVLGLGSLRRFWFNLDRLWALAFIGAGAAMLVTA